MKLLYKLSVFQNLKKADWTAAFGELIKPFFSSNPNLKNIKEAFSYGQRIDSMDEFEKGFEKIVQDVVKDGRLIIFIDDLDRCLPEKTIEILEVIKLFLDVPRCVFVLGVEKEVIERGIEVRYKSGEQGIPISGKDYIEKIIQIPFTLPPIRVGDMTRFIASQRISEKEKGYAEIVAKGTGCNPRKVKMFLNTLKIRQAIAERTGDGIELDLFAKLFVIEYTFHKFYKDVVKYKEQDFLCTLEKLARGERDDELRKGLDDSETLQRYYKTEDLKSLLKDEPFFCGIDIEPYIYLSGTKVPEEAFGFDKSVLDVLLSGDSLKIEHATSEIEDLPDSDKQQYLNITLSKLKENNPEVRLKAVMALGRIGDATAVKPLIGALKDDNVNVRWNAPIALGRIGDATAVEPLKAALKNEDERMRWSAAYALEEIGDDRAIEPLIEALNDENPNVRWNVAHALGDIGDDRAIEPLEVLVHDDDDIDVHEGAKKALDKIKAKQNRGGAGAYYEKDK